MAGIKIVDLPAVGRDLAATDLFEMSLVGGTGSRKITGQEIMNASKLSVNNTPVINGTAGRIFFQGSTNVLQQSANLSWDNTTNILNVIGVGKFNLNGTSVILNNPSGRYTDLAFANADSIKSFVSLDNSQFYLDLFNSANYGLRFWTNNAERMRIAATGNVLIGTTTDAGYKLDVNGNVRVNNLFAEGNVVLDTSNVWLSNGFAIGEYTTGNNRIEFYTTKLSLITNGNDVMTLLNSGNVGIGITNPSQKLTIAGNNSIMFTGVSAQNMPSYVGTDSSDNFYVYSAGQGSGKSSYFGPSNGTHLRTIANFLDLYVGNGAPILGLRLNSTGNILINTTTDAGFRLDVNGDTIFRRITNVTPNTITGGTQFFTVKSGNWPTALIRCFENGVINLGSSSGSIGFDSSTFNFPVSSTFGFNYVPVNQLDTYALRLNASYTNVGAGGTSEGTMLRTSGSTSTSVGTVTMNQIESKPTYNNTGGTTINRGFYYNPILTSMTNTTHYAIHSTSGRVRLEGLPTSPTGLSAGDLYNDGGTIKIV